MGRISCATRHATEGPQKGHPRRPEAAEAASPQVSATRQTTSRRPPPGRPSSPPTLVGTIFGMNVDHMPELTWRYGYPAVLTVIVAACTLVHRALRRNKWRWRPLMWPSGSCLPADEQQAAHRRGTLGAPTPY
ncbi:CorA family divalent cation transporter [Streptomyces sp. NPDC001815]|uniref:CorA family divalent cation transporter n=1 Tax=Streptomyces sp. NPDC001815 TaxID=3154526 RepID=UPI00331E94F8